MLLIVTMEDANKDMDKAYVELMKKRSKILDNTNYYIGTLLCLIVVFSFLVYDVFFEG